MHHLTTLRRLLLHWRASMLIRHIGWRVPRLRRVIVVVFHDRVLSFSLMIVMFMNKVYKSLYFLKYIVEHRLLIVYAYNLYMCL